MSDETEEAKAAAQEKAAAEKAAAQEKGKVEVRILRDEGEHKCGTTAKLSKGAAEAAVLAGWADDSAAAVAYAKKS